MTIVLWGGGPWALGPGPGTRAQNPPDTLGKHQKSLFETTYLLFSIPRELFLSILLNQPYLPPAPKLYLKIWSLHCVILWKRSQNHPKSYPIHPKMTSEGFHKWCIQEHNGGTPVARASSGVHGRDPRARLFRLLIAIH